MYSFEEFKEELVAMLRERMKDEDVSIAEHATTKNNCVKIGVSFLTRPEGTINASPIVYIEQMYDDYRQGRDMDEICDEVIYDYRQALNEKIEIEDKISDIMSDKENIVFTLVQTECNEQWLQNVPHREFMDMSVVYRWFVGGNGIVNATVVITNSIAEQKGLTEQELYELAYENTKNVFKPQCFGMLDYLKENVENFDDSVQPTMNLYVICNEQGMYGATSILYENILDEVANKLGSDLYLLPSSVHEFLAVSTNADVTLEKLENMVYEVNFSQVDIQDRLSNQIYHYDRSTKQVTQISNTPYTRLDVMEKELDFQDMDNEEFDEGEGMGMQLTI